MIVVKLFVLQKQLVAKDEMKIIKFCQFLLSYKTVLKVVYHHRKT